MANNGILQRLAVRRRLKLICNRSTDTDLQSAAADALANFEDFYKLTMVIYVEQTGSEYKTAEDGIILDKLLEFFKFLVESGILEMLLKLFAGMGMNQILITYEDSPEFLKALMSV